MGIQYSVTGGQLFIDKKVFAKEMLLAGSFLRNLITGNLGKGSKPPVVTKTEDMVTIDFNYASHILLADNFEDQFRTLKVKYLAKVKGRVTLSFSLLSTYHTVIDLNSEDDRVVREN